MCLFRPFRPNVRLNARAKSTPASRCPWKCYGAGNNWSLNRLPNGVLGYEVARGQAMNNGVNTYTRFDGLPELRRALAEKLADYNSLVADPETDITVSAGATGAFHCACLALLNPGDEVIVFEPTYAYHLSAIVAVE